jgi:hypothetical protein
MPAILFLLSTILKTIPLSLFNASSAVVMNAMWSRKSRTVFVYILPHALPCFLACCFIHHANETTDFLTSQKRQALPSSSRFLLLIIAYQWSNMGNRGFLHTTPAPMMPTILSYPLLKSVSLRIGCCTTALARQIPYPLAFVFSHLHSTVLSILQIWTISSSWLAYKRTSKLSAI